MTTVQYNQDVFFFVGATDGSSNRQANVTVTVDDPSLAFVGFANPNVVKCVPKTQAGATVNLTISATSQNGAILPSKTAQITFLAKPTPQATQITINPVADPLDSESVNNAGVTDNGQGMVSFTVNPGL